MLGVARGIASLWAGGYAIPLSFGEGAGLAPPSSRRCSPGASTCSASTCRHRSSTSSASVPIVVARAPTHRLRTPRLRRRRQRDRGAALRRQCQTASRSSSSCCSGLFAGLAALLHAALVNQGSHIDGNGYELNAIAAVVIGGTSLAGGVGTVVGSMIGALTLSILDNILGLRNVQSEYQAILKGVIIVLAVFVQRQRR